MPADVVIYTSEPCPYCHAARELLCRKGVVFREVAVSNRDDLRDWLKLSTKQLTVPQIFINGVSVGGFSELAALDRAGRLKQLLGADPLVDEPKLPM